MEKTIFLPEKIDSNNVYSVENDILSQIGSFAGKLVLDAGNLKYISSAGLRMIQRFKKLNNSTKVINCNSDIYEIFCITGFNIMLEISKALREVSIDGCEVIGEGFYGTVYRIDSETIVKVYRSICSMDMIKNEIELARKAFILGIPTAIPYDIVKVGNWYGAVFELIRAEALQKHIIRGACIDEIAKKSVDVLKLIHSTKLAKQELPDKKLAEISMVRDCEEFLPKNVVDRLIRLIEDIPQTYTMLHGDFHIKNIMMQDGEIILIDMDKLSMGHPIFELSAIYATYNAFAAVDKSNIRNFLGITDEQSHEFFSATFKHYFDGKSQAYIDSIIEKCKILAFLFVLWLKTRETETTEMIEKEIQYSRKFLIENIPKIESLAF